jgi:putative restriction endonuclease
MSAIRTMTTPSLSIYAVEAEFQRRLSMWDSIKAQGDLSKVLPQFLRDLGAYGGAQGIWVNTAKTVSTSGDATGVTVGLLHRGISYADDLSDDGVLYHFPKTKRPPGRDRSEISATKAACQLGLPVFVISPGKTSSTRTVHLAWVEDWDDESEVFLVLFGENRPTRIIHNEKDEDSADFQPTSPTSKRPYQITTVPRLARFQFEVFKRYRLQCAVCRMNILDLLDAAHIVPKREFGTDDPRNGLVLCCLHHRAYDAGMFKINPDTLELATTEGHDYSSLRIEFSNLLHLPKKPHRKALEHRWRMKATDLTD